MHLLDAGFPLLFQGQGGPVVVKDLRGVFRMGVYFTRRLLLFFLNYSGQHNVKKVRSKKFKYKFRKTMKICHNKFSLYNLKFSDGQGNAVILI